MFHYSLESVAAIGLDSLALVGNRPYSHELVFELPPRHLLCYEILVPIVNRSEIANKNTCE